MTSIATTSSLLEHHTGKSLSPRKRKWSNAQEKRPLDDRSNNVSHVTPERLFEQHSDDESERSNDECATTVVKRTKIDHAHDDYQRSSDAPETQAQKHLGAVESAALGPCSLGPRALPFSVMPQSSSAWTPTSCLIGQTCQGKRHVIRRRNAYSGATHAELAAARSTAAPGRAQRAFYGIDIHNLMRDAEKENQRSSIKASDAVQGPTQSIETVSAEERRAKSMMWTEKYRARKFTDLIGDDRTHRLVMHWLKRWDPIVFPNSRSRAKVVRREDDGQDGERAHRKVLLLTGPPGLGKTTLAHVCAKQAGFEVQEINASDERSKDIVKGRIRDMVGTENVKQVQLGATSTSRIARPVCVVVDEVDGAVTGTSGSGEGGFIKALLDLVALDQKNIERSAHRSVSTTSRAKRKGDNFRMMRPLILICNDVYHPSLRPLRQSSIAEVVHIGRAMINNVALRLQTIFQRENVPADGDAVRKLCEASWGVTSRKENVHGQGTGEGDMRSIMVMAEWAAGRLRASESPEHGEVPRLTKRWLEDVFLTELGKSGGAARGLGRGGYKEIVERVFQEGAGLNKATAQCVNSEAVLSIDGVKGVAEAFKAKSTQRLREMIDSAAESDKIISDCFTSYPEYPFHDDTLLSKPCAAYDWLYLHDVLSKSVFTTNEWELAPYLSQPILAFHHLFATSKAARGKYASWAEPTTNEEPLPFTGSQAAYAAHEAQKSHDATLLALKANLSLPLSRIFPTSTTIGTDLVPYLSRILSPAVNPVLISGTGDNKHNTTASVRKASEKTLVDRAVNGMLATGVTFDKMRLDTNPNAPTAGHGAQQARQHAGWIYRMEPPLDAYAAFETGAKGSAADVSGIGQRFAVRQTLDQECRRIKARLEAEARKRRFDHGGPANEDGPVPLTESAATMMDEQDNHVQRTEIKRDFFGREIVGVAATADEHDNKSAKAATDIKQRRVWLSYHEGSSTAVRKPITLAEIMREFA